MPKLTIGCAVYDDADRLWATVQSLRANQIKHVQSKENLADWTFEFVIVDNKPAPVNYVNKTQQFAESLRNQGVRYIPMASPSGTTQSRNRIFKEADGDYVLAIDCHIQLHFGALAALLSYYQDFPDTPDLIQGPIVWDDMDSGRASTHMANYWRSHMWGIWSTAWFTPQGYVDIIQDAEGICQFRTVDMASAPIDIGYKRSIPWAGHERFVRDHLGWVSAADYHVNRVFEIPGHGLGLFSCKKDKWLGFNEHFREFGGEEMYIQEKFRQAGHRCLCMPFLAWTHHFGGPQGGQPYSNTIYGKTRNYVLGHMELGRPISEVYNHFVSLAYKEDTLREHLILEHSVTHSSFLDKMGKPVPELALVELHADSKHKMPENHWKHIIADPIGHEKPPASQVLKEVAEVAKVIESPDATYLRYCNTPRDLDKHLPRLRELASLCGHVTEISKRKESFVALAVSNCAEVHSYNIELGKSEYDQIVAQVDRKLVWKNTKPTEPIEMTDMLFIDSEHTAACLDAELKMHAKQVGRFIVMHDTELHAMTGEDRGPGLFMALRPFLEENKEWFVCYHTPEEFGLTVLSKDPSDTPDQVIRLWSPGYGPGTETKRILEKLDIHSQPGCDCNTKMAQMDMWGIEGCRLRRTIIVNWFKDNYKKWGWAKLTDNQSYLSVAWKAVFSGLAFQINPLDPWGSLVDLAISNAEKSHKE